MSTGSAETDREILVQLYQLTNGNNWKRRGGWNDRNLDLRSWFGVKTNDEGRVVELDLHFNNLRGMIPSELGGLSALEKLSLAGNNLGGAIPSELGRLRALETLSLEYNKLSGAIPSEVGGLSALRTLHLSNNELSGAIPPELGGLSALEALHLERNYLSGALPSQLGRLSALETLHLADNQLSDIGDHSHALELVSKFDTDERYFIRGKKLLELRGNPWKMPPEAVVEQGLEAIKIYLGDVQKASENGAQVRSLKLLKVVLVGAASAGKTSLMESIMRGTGMSSTEGTLEEASTVGIDLRHYLLPGIKVEFYDCAGHVDYTGMHQTFLSRRTLYLLVWDVNRFIDVGEQNLQKIVHRNIMRWLYTIRAPESNVILVANKCDTSSRDYGETRFKVEKLVKHLLQEWQERRMDGDVNVVRLLDGVSPTSCVNYGGIDELVERFSWECSTSIQVPPAWDLALKVLDALRAGDDPLRAARLHLGLYDTYAKLDQTVPIVTNTFPTKSELLILWQDIVGQVSGELQSTAAITATYNWESAFNGALWISEFAGQILRIDDDGVIFLDVVWLSKVLSPILSHKLHAGDFRTSKLKYERDILVRRGVLRWDFAQHLWRDVLTHAEHRSKGYVIEYIFRILLQLGVIIPLGRPAFFSDPRRSLISHGDRESKDMLVIMRLPEECGNFQQRDVESSVGNVRRDCQEVKLKWEIDAAQAPYGLVERLISSCHVIGEVEQDAYWRYGALFVSHAMRKDNRTVRLYKFLISYDNCMLSLRMRGPLSDDRVLYALRYVASAMVVLSMEWPEAKWEGWLECPNHPKARIYMMPPGQASVGDQLLDQEDPNVRGLMCNCLHEADEVFQLVHQGLGTVVDTREVSVKEDPKFYIGERKVIDQMSEDEDDGMSDDEVDVSDESQGRKTATMAASNPGLDKRSSKFGIVNEVILAKGLGTQAMEFLDSSFGIELILADNSLEKEIKEQVVVKPGMKLVTCGDEPDTSRTHDDLREWSSSKYHDGETSDASTFLIMPIIHGPDGATFHPDRPAKLRYFVGKLEDLQKEIRGKGEGDYSPDAVAKYLREVYKPFISADEEKWRMLPPFGCIFKTNCNEATDVWLETRLYHFSANAMGKAMGKLLSRFKRKKLSRHVHVCNKPWWKGYGDHVIFGNLTEKWLVYYAFKLRNTTATARGRGLGVNVESFGVTADTQVEIHSQPISDFGHIRRFVVEENEFWPMSMPKEGGVVHDQVFYAVFWVEKLPCSSATTRRQFLLYKENANNNKMVIVRQSMIDRWSRQEGMGTQKQLNFDASIPDVVAFLEKYP